jgi:hypothetical protein
MNDIDIQTRYWDSVAASKTFTNPIALLKTLSGTPDNHQVVR